MAKLKAALPLPALATPPLLAQLHEQAPGRDLCTHAAKTPAEVE
jgi:hypothetical protein